MANTLKWSGYAEAPVDHIKDKKLRRLITSTQRELQKIDESYGQWVLEPLKEREHDDEVWGIDEVWDIVGQAYAHGLDTGYCLTVIDIMSAEANDIRRGSLAKQNDDQTLKVANDRRSASRADFWRPYQQDFQSLVSQGMKRARARSVIADLIPKPGGEVYSDKTLRKWLR